MYGRVISFLAAVATVFAVSFFFLSVPASAQNVDIPEGFAVEVANVGEVHARPTGELVEAFATTSDGTVLDVVFGGCTVRWSTNDSFYFIMVEDVGLFMTPAKLFDSFLARARFNFTAAMSDALAAESICAVHKIWKYSE